MKNGGIIGTVTLALLAASGIQAQNTPLGVPEDGLPGWHERTTFTLINASRLDPPTYGKDYLSGSNPLTGYSARYPLVHHIDLIRAARYHSEDMMSCNDMDHNSCDGTRAGTRVRRFYDSYHSECIARGQRSPQAVVDAWLHSNHGHRDALMTRRSSHIGCGHADGRNGPWWTIDLAGGNYTHDNPIYGGTHHFAVSNKTAFWANYCTGSGNPPRSAVVYIDGKGVDLAPVLGDDDNGVYGVHLAQASSCRSYHFGFVDDKGAAWRYPEEGQYHTFGEGSCTKDYSESAPVAYRPAPLQDRKTARTSPIVILTGTRLPVTEGRRIVSLNGRTVPKGEYHSRGIVIAFPDGHTARQTTDSER